MKARVHVMLKNGVLDPQGEAVRHALGARGFAGVNNSLSKMLNPSDSVTSASPETKVEDE